MCSPGGTSIIIIIRYNLGKFVFARWHFHHHHQIQPWQVCVLQVVLPSSSSSDTTLASLYSPGGTSIIIIIRYNLGKFVFARWHFHHHHQIQLWQVCVLQVALPSSSSADTTLASLYSPGGTSIIIIIRYNLGKFVFAGGTSIIIIIRYNLGKFVFARWHFHHHHQIQLGKFVFTRWHFHHHHQIQPWQVCICQVALPASPSSSDTTLASLYLPGGTSIIIIRYSLGEFVFARWHFHHHRQIQPWQVCIRQVALPSSSSDTTLASLYLPGGTSIIIFRFNLDKFVFAWWHFHHHHQIQPWQVCICQVALPSSSSDTALASLYSPGGTSIIIIRYNLSKFVFARWHFHHHHQIQLWKVCVRQVALSSSDTTLESLCSPGGTSIIMSHGYQHMLL